MKITITKKLSKKISQALKGFMGVLLILSLYTCVSEEPAKPNKITEPDKITIPEPDKITRFDFTCSKCYSKNWLCYK